MLLVYAMVVLFVVSFAPVPFYWDLYARRREPRYRNLLMLGWAVYAAAPIFYYLGTVAAPAFSVGFAASELVGSTLFIVGAISYFTPIDSGKVARRVLAAGGVLVILDLIFPALLFATIGIHTTVLVAAQTYAIVRRKEFKAVGGSSYGWLVGAFFIGIGAAIWWLFSIGGTSPLPFLGTTTATVAVGYFFVHFEHAAALNALQAQEKELVAHRTHLQSLVEARTTEVLEANERLEHLNAALEATNANLDEAVRARSDLLARTSHELRTPLNSVIGFSGTLLQGLAGPLNEEQNKQLSMIRRAGQHLLSLVNDVLDISAAEAGQHSFEFETHAVAEIVEPLVESLRPTADGRGLDLECLVTGDATVHTDRRALEQVLLNLLDNALKYTEHGSVTLEAGPCDEGVRFVVRDTGPGISPDDLERIFQPFVRLGDVDPKATGTGLGLSVVQSLSSAIGGRLKASSRPGEGSAFELVLPRQATSGMALEPA